MDIDYFQYFGFPQYFCSEMTLEKDDPEDPILTSISRKFFFSIGEYFICITPYDKDHFQYYVKNNGGIIFNSKGYPGLPSYQNISNMLKYYDALLNRKDCTAILSEMYQPHVDCINGKELHNIFDTIKSMTITDLEETLRSVSEEMGISFDSPQNPEDKD